LYVCMFVYHIINKKKKESECKLLTESNIESYDKLFSTQEADTKVIAHAIEFAGAIRPA